MTPRELAAAIRRGHTMIGETAKNFYDSGCGCAIGAAAAGIGISEKEFSDRWLKFVYDSDCIFLGAAEIFNCDVKLLKDISYKHISGTPRLAIADWLDTLEPERNPQDKQTFDAFMAQVMKPVEVTV